MAELLAKLGNKVRHHVDALVTDPDAERAARQREAQRAKTAARDRAEAATAAKAAADEAAQRQAAEEASRREFSKARLAQNTARMAGKGIGIALLLLVMLLGATLAANAVVYKPAPLRVAAFLYGGLFSPFVVAYMLGVRWAWYGRRPPYYALLPLVPMRFRHTSLLYALGWLCYKPDEGIEALAAEQAFTRALT